MALEQLHKEVETWYLPTLLPSWRCHPGMTCAAASIPVRDLAYKVWRAALVNYPQLGLSL